MGGMNGRRVRGKCSGNSIIRISAAIICFRRGTEAVVESRKQDRLGIIVVE